MKIRPVPSYGDVFTLSEFCEMVEHGCFIDYDGTGYFGWENGVSDYECRPSGIVKGLIPSVDPAFTHVHWYNK